MTEFPMEGVRRIAALITEDPDIMGDRMSDSGAAHSLGGGDAERTNDIRKQMEQQRRLQEKNRQEQQKKVDPFFNQLDDTEEDLEGIADELQAAQDQEQTQLDLFNTTTPALGQAIRGLRSSLKL